MSMSIKGLQQVQAALKKEVDKLRTSHYALVGIHESAGQAKDSDITTATLGAIQHFGNDDIPARPWLDKGLESGTKEILETIQEGIAEGGDAKQVIARAGQEAESAIKQYIDDLDTPPNKPATIKQKGSSNPLIDTGNMRNSVTSVVVRKKPQEGL